MQTVFAAMIAIFYGLFVRLIFGIAPGWEVMSGAFLGLMPLVFGFLSVWFLKPESAKSKVTAFFFPWLTTLGLLILTILFSLEGTICWIMIYPFFAALAGLGGLAARHFLLKKMAAPDGEKPAERDNFHQKNGLQVSLLLVLPIVVGWLESGKTNEKQSFSMENTIEIDANSAKIWQNVTRVHPIQPAEDKATINRWLGMPRPIEAELDTQAVGGYRKAIFERGMVFHETVTLYESERLMAFSIKANPDEIPPTAMDEHIVVGGKYFDVLNGEYRLEKLPDGRSRLHLSSRFVVSTPFNFYSGKWAQWIMWDIQRNILQVIKSRSEG